MSYFGNRYYGSNYWANDYWGGVAIVPPGPIVTITDSGWKRPKKPPVQIDVTEFMRDLQRRRRQRREDEEIVLL